MANTLDNDLKDAELTLVGSAKGVSDEQRLSQIEKALSGLTVEDAQYLLRKVSKSITSKSLVVSA